MLTLMVALAMQSSSTNCYTLGNTVQCNTYQQPSYAPPPPLPGFNAMGALGAFQMGQEARAREEARRRYEAPPPPPQSYASPNFNTAGQARASFVQQLAERMAAHINNGRCRESYDLATLSGEAGMAAESQRICPF